MFLSDLEVVYFNCCFFRRWCRGYTSAGLQAVAIVRVHRQIKVGKLEFSTLLNEQPPHILIGCQKNSKIVGLSNQLIEVVDFFLLLKEN